MRSFTLLLTVILFACKAGAQPMPDIKTLLSTPRHYTALKTVEKIQIDGRDEEAGWKKAPWTEMFGDIVTGRESGHAGRTRCKMLWDDDFLYLYVQLEEQDLWASITRHDGPVYHDNAFEVFIDPDGNAHTYFEFQINAYETVWDLFLPKPYRNGGRALSSWDVKGIKKAVHLNGTLNDPSDRDKGWSIELAFPFMSLGMGGRQPQTGAIWRMNFSRVQREADTVNRAYTLKRDHTGKLLPEHYIVWSPQGIVNLHYPERYGYVLFSDPASPSDFLSDAEERARLTLWKYYYLQQDFKNKYGTYARSVDQLDKAYPAAPAAGEFELKMEATEHQFLIRCYIASSEIYLSVDQDGELRKKN